jgi:hypothetical protein
MYTVKRQDKRQTDIGVVERRMILKWILKTEWSVDWIQLALHAAQWQALLESYHARIVIRTLYEA